MAEHPLAGQRPSKIVAVHASYRSRAMERGDLPPWPSYFLKPPNTLAADGDPVLRPPWCELLAFEGEVALIIGDRATRVTPADGLGATSGWVTAANDFGVYDLRYADRGSNVRSKGIDGFTPLGPALLDARTVDPEHVRLRTWVNGELAQDAVSGDDLLFSFADIVADISRLTTLEPGDVILTGTPTGLHRGPARRPGRGRGQLPARQTTGRLRSPVERSRIYPQPARRDARRGRRAAGAAYGARGAPGARRLPRRAAARPSARSHRDARRRSCASAATTPSPWTGCTPPGRPRRWPGSPGRCATCRSARTCSPVRRDTERRRDERPEAGRRAGPARRDPGHRGARRPDRGHGRRHPRAARPGPRRARASSPTARSGTARRCTSLDIPVYYGATTRRCSADGTSRGRPTSRSPAPASPCSRATSSPATRDGVIVIPRAPGHGRRARRRRAGAAGAVHRRDGRQGRVRRRAVPDREDAGRLAYEAWLGERSPEREIHAATPAADPRVDRAGGLAVHRRRRGPTSTGCAR